MANAIDYSTIDIPQDESPDNYHYTARRAEILQAIFRAGSPSAISQTQLAERYGVTQGQISQDVDALGEHISESLGSRASLETRSAYERIKRELMDNGEWKEAWDVIMDWNEWLADIGEQHREPRRSELDVEQRSANVDVAYEVVREGEVESGSDGGESEDVDPEDLFTATPVGTGGSDQDDE